MVPFAGGRLAAKPGGVSRRVSCSPIIRRGALGKAKVHPPYAEEWRAAFCRRVGWRSLGENCEFFDGPEKSDCGSWNRPYLHELHSPDDHPPLKASQASEARRIRPA